MRKCFCFEFYLIRIIDQAYDEHLQSMKFDMKDREEVKNQEVTKLAVEIKKGEDRMDAQAKVIDMYVNFSNERNKELISALENQQVEER